MFNYGSIDFKMGYISARLEDVSKGNCYINEFIDEVNKVYAEFNVKIDFTDVETIIEFYTSSEMEDIEIKGKMYKKIWDLDMCVYVEHGKLYSVDAEEEE